MGRKRTRLYIKSMPSTEIMAEMAEDNFDKDFGIQLSKEWHKLLKPYIPVGDTKKLSSRVEYKPFEIIYRMKYAHYQYTGVVYEDPLYHVAGFRTSSGQWYSRKGIKKVARTVPTGGRMVNLQYNNPMAVDHWDVQAQKAGKDKDLYRIMNAYLKNRQK